MCSALSPGVPTDHKSNREFVGAEYRCLHSTRERLQMCLVLHALSSFVTPICVVVTSAHVSHILKIFAL